MKKNNIIYKLSFLFILASIFASCDDAEEAIYNGDVNNDTFVSFDKQAYNLPVERNAEGSLIIKLQSSAKRSAARTYNLNVIDSLTSAEPNTYEIPSTITIPADEYIGEVTIKGIDNNVNIAPESLYIQFEAIEGENLGYTAAEISIYEVCPIPQDFLVGQYAIEDISAAIGPANGTTNFGPATVNITIGETSTSRVFTTDLYPGIVGSKTIEISLICSELVFAKDIDSGIGCSDPNNLILAKATAGGYINTTYSLEEEGDDSIIINYTEDIEGSCGGPMLSSFSLTKI
ncbi:hypothetical protein [Mesonia aestuariivivens]|uniref:DUF1735 domain-containing protein n=1 Tax=Mesonia aestuariivivens TaxID=2796128 RepID=A0ABS6W2Z3_9FLAO|nr:hypothetical protein [Mesonia aestuariivivens]MBW2962225.1 hypothetical protein [Mesonia aestuariivivens]